MPTTNSTWLIGTMLRSMLTQVRDLRVSSANFNLHSRNSAPTGITYANNRFYVIDWANTEVYAYTSSGSRVSSADFDLHRDNTDPQGITYVNNRFYVVDGEDAKVYVYTSSSQ